MKRRLRALLAAVLGVLMTGAVLAEAGFKMTPKGAEYQDLQVGEGESAKLGDVAIMHFVGWLAEGRQRGKEIFNTRNEGSPVSFVVGTDRVMEGWNEGVVGMRPGGRRLLIIPPGLAYGAKAVDDVIPANASLMFVIELIAVEEANR